MHGDEELAEDLANGDSIEASIARIFSNAIRLLGAQGSPITGMNFTHQGQRFAFDRVMLKNIGIYRLVKQG